ncbi:hypothetical protein Ciccas_011320, partial [Cichlidogyrus casuarinus]
NQLERDALQLLSFNINVGQEDYAKYFFELVSLDQYFCEAEQSEKQASMLDLAQLYDCSGEIFEVATAARLSSVVEKALKRSLSCGCSFKYLGCAGTGRKQVQSTSMAATKVPPLDEFDDDYACLLWTKKLAFDPNETAIQPDSSTNGHAFS